MDRVLDLLHRARDDLAVAIRQKDRYLALVKQPQAVRIETRPAFACVTRVPCAQFHPPAMMTGPEDHNITFGELEANGCFRSFNLGSTDRFSGLQPLDAAQPGNIDQHPSANDPLRVRGNIIAESAPARNQVGRATIVQLAFVGDMAQGVDVSMAVSVELHTEEVGGKTEQLARSNINVVGGAHIMNGRVWVIRPGDRVDRNRHRYAATALDKCSRGPNLVWRDVIQGAFFIVRPPSSPVLERLE